MAIVKIFNKKDQGNRMETNTFQKYMVALSSNDHLSPEDYLDLESRSGSAGIIGRGGG